MVTSPPFPVKVSPDLVPNDIPRVSIPWTFHLGAGSRDNERVKTRADSVPWPAPFTQVRDPSRRAFLRYAAQAMPLAVARMPAQGPDRPRLTVLSFNIHHGEGTDGVIDLQRTANAIRPAAADFVALQEVDRNTGRSNGVDQAQILADLLDMPVVFGSALDFDGGQYGNALLTRHAIVSSISHTVPHSDGREPRIVLEAEVDLDPLGGTQSTVRILVTHLDQLAGDVDRLAAVEVIERVVAERGDTPMILAGDLNAAPGSAPLERLRESWLIAGDGEPFPTIPAARPVRRIDYSLCRPPGRWRVAETRVLEEVEASDHRPIAASLEIRQP